MKQLSTAKNCTSSKSAVVTALKASIGRPMRPVRNAKPCFSVTHSHPWQKQLKSMDMLHADYLLLSLFWAVLSCIFSFILQCFCNWGTDEKRENQPIEHSPVAKWALKFPQEAMSFPMATCYTLNSLTFSVWNIIVLRKLKRPRAVEFKHPVTNKLQSWLHMASAILNTTGMYLYLLQCRQNQSVLQEIDRSETTKGISTNILLSFISFLGKSKTNELRKWSKMTELPYVACLDPRSLTTSWQRMWSYRTPSRNREHLNTPCLENGTKLIKDRLVDERLIYHSQKDQDQIKPRNSLAASWLGRLHSHERSKIDQFWTPAAKHEHEHGNLQFHNACLCIMVSTDVAAPFPLVKWFVTSERQVENVSSMYKVRARGQTGLQANYTPLNDTQWQKQHISKHMKS